MATTATTATTARKPAARKPAARKPAATTATEPKNTIDIAAEYAEKVVLIPVGAALTARDTVVESVNEVFENYSSRAKTETQLKRFERRGVKARNGLERDVKKTRTRVERELRLRRRRVERTFKQLDKQSTKLQKDVTAQLEQVQTQIEKSIKSGNEWAAKVQERVFSGTAS